MHPLSASSTPRAIKLGTELTVKLFVLRKGSLVPSVKTKEKRKKHTTIFMNSIDVQFPNRYNKLFERYY